jgi:hypothetical protein
MKIRLLPVTSIKTYVFWKAALCTPDDGSSKYIRNMGSISTRLHGAIFQKKIIFNNLPNLITAEKLWITITLLPNK